MELMIPEAYKGLWLPARHKAFFGGRGSAKSHTIAEYIGIEGARRRHKIVCGRQFQNSIRESVKELIEKKLYKNGLNDGYKILDREIMHRSTGTRFLFVGLDRNPDSAKSLEGTSIFWGEEAQTLSEKSMEIIIPTVRDPGSEMLWSWNPRYRTDPVDDMFRGPEVPKKSVIQEVSWRDNPYFFNTEMPEEMYRLKRRNKSRWKHVWEGAYDEAADAQIFQRAKVGRIEVTEDDVPRYGLDFGFGADPSSVVKVYVLYDRNIVYIAQEAFGYGVPTRHLPELIDSVAGANTSAIYADSARPDTIEELQHKGYDVRAARKLQGSIKHGIEWLNGFDIWIDPECYNMREEARLYFWKVDPLGKPLPIPVDKHNHGWDATRYATENDQLGEPDGVGFIRA